MAAGSTGADYGSVSALPSAYEHYLEGGGSAFETKPTYLRRKWNWSALFVAAVLPWVIFTVVLAVASFPVAAGEVFEPNQLCYFVSAIAAFVVLAFGLLAFVAWQQTHRQGPQEPTWYSFIFAAGLVAWVLGLGLGRANYHSNVVPYRDIANLAFYTQVDPAVMRGTQLMDAGRITFTENSRVNVSMSEGFKHGSVYCVAPIVSENGSLERYDFWAVGTDCCNAHSSNFHCGDAHRARSGVRLINEDERTWYRMALQQAEEANHIRADFAIFVKWVQDPTAAINELSDDSVKFFVWWVVVHGVVQVLAVAAIMVALWKLGW
mmetsp:Transcript_49551/g.114823  ORF Transcript_49551/g.114823 Transcript_49551/m.114823 type:complete len:321 (+) Transcript_49551:70-1032(+)